MIANLDRYWPGFDTRQHRDLFGRLSSSRADGSNEKRLYRSTFKRSRVMGPTDSDVPHTGMDDADALNGQEKPKSESSSVSETSHGSRTELGMPQTQSRFGESEAVVDSETTDAGSSAVQAADIRSR